MSLLEGLSSFLYEEKRGRSDPSGTGKLLNGESAMLFNLPAEGGGQFRGDLRGGTTERHFYPLLHSGTRLFKNSWMPKR